MGTIAVNFFSNCKEQTLYTFSDLVKLQWTLGNAQLKVSEQIIENFFIHGIMKNDFVFGDQLCLSVAKFLTFQHETVKDLLSWRSGFPACLQDFLLMYNSWKNC